MPNNDYENGYFEPAEELSNLEIARNSIESSFQYLDAHEEETNKRIAELEKRLAERDKKLQYILDTRDLKFCAVKETDEQLRSRIETLKSDSYSIVMRPQMIAMLEELLLNRDQLAERDELLRFALEYIQEIKSSQIQIEGVVTESDTWLAKTKEILGE